MLWSEKLKTHDCRTADPITKRLEGCDEPRQEPAEFDGFLFDRCPAFYLDDPDFVKDAMRIYNWREKGILPYPGSLRDQPNLILEVCEYLDYLVSEKQRRQLEAMKPKSK